MHSDMQYTHPAHAYSSTQIIYFVPAIYLLDGFWCKVERGGRLIKCSNDAR